MNNPVKPDRHAQNKKPVGSKERIDGGVTKERGENAGWRCAVIPGPVDTHMFFPTSN